MEARAAQRNIIAGTPEGGWYERLDSSRSYTTGSRSVRLISKQVIA